MPEYTNFQDVKKVLEVGNQDANYFSGGIERVTVQDENNRSNLDLIFDVNEIDSPSDLSESLNFEIKITSSSPPYNYDIYEKTKSQGVRRKIQSGDTGSDVTISSCNITIKSSVWGGVIEEGDVVLLEFSTLISEDQAKHLIDEAEIMIDAGIREAGIRLDDQGNGRVFAPSSIPQEIQLAAQYLSAYYIYVNVFAEDLNDLKATSGPSRWKQRAGEYVDKWMEGQGHNAPKVSSFPPIVDKIGVDDDVGPGYAEKSSDLDELDRDSQIDDIFDFNSYDGDAYE